MIKWKVCILKYNGHLEEKDFCCYLKTELVFSWNIINNWKNDWLTNYDYQNWAFGKYFLKNAKSEYFIWKEAVDDANKKLKLPNKNQNFGEFLSTTMGLMTSQYLKTFLMRLEKMWFFFWYCLIKCVNIWKICIN